MQKAARLPGAACRKRHAERETYENGSAARSRHDFELTHGAEDLVALFYLRPRHGPQPFQAERFHVETREHAAVDHRATERAEIQLAICRGKVTGHAAGERV